MTWMYFRRSWRMKPGGVSKVADGKMTPDADPESSHRALQTS